METLREIETEMFNIKEEIKIKEKQLNNFKRARYKASIDLKNIKDLESEIKKLNIKFDQLKEKRKWLILQEAELELERNRAA